MERLHSELVCTTNKLVLVPNMDDLEQPKALNWSAAEFALFHFGQKLIFAHGIEFSISGGFRVQVDFQTYHNTICKLLVDHWYQKEIV